MLRRAGITTEEQLRALGAVRAYVMVKRCSANASLNLLWALEGALTNRGRGNDEGTILFPRPMANKCVERLFARRSSHLWPGSRTSA